MSVKPIGYYEKRFANRNTKKGLPDMHICICGTSLEIELKADNGIPSELQIKICEQIRESGGQAFVLYPSGFFQFQKIVKDMKNDLFYDIPIILK